MYISHVEQGLTAPYIVGMTNSLKELEAESVKTTRADITRKRFGRKIHEG